MKQKIAILGLLFILFNITIFGQTGKTKSSLKWLKIETDHFEILYTSLWKPEAEQVARNLEELYVKDTLLGTRRLGKTRIILQGNTLQSNGFVSFAPFRSEFFLMAPQNAFLSSGNWLDLLSIHEYHHILQHHKIKTGIVQYFSLLFGEFGQAFSANLFIPRWFWEGDAVYSETKYSHGGRGRSSEFLKYYRAIAKEGRKFRLRRAIGGTYNKRTPNHYHLGYLLSNKIRNEKGENAFEPIIDKTVGGLIPFTKSIYKESGKRLNQHFVEALYLLKEQENAKESWETTPLIQTKKNNFYTDQIAITQSSEGIYYVNKDFKHIPSIRSIKDTSPLAKPGISLDNYHNFGINDEYICWSEYTKHPRWEMEDYSIVRIKNRSTGKQRTLQKRAKHFHPQLHPSKNVIVLLSANERNEMSLEYWDLDGNKRIKTIPLAYDHARELYFNEDGSSLCMIVSKGQRQGILRVDLNSDQQSLLIPLQYEALNSPKLYGDHLYFLANSNTDQYIYRLSVSDRTLHKSNKKFLHCQSFILEHSTGNLYYNDYSNQGYSVKVIPSSKLKDSFKQSSELQEELKAPLFATKISERIATPVKSYIPKYKVHSYSPFISRNSSGTTHFSLDLYINDYLSTSGLFINYRRDLQGEDHRYRLDYTYGYLPVVFGIEARHDAANIVNSKLHIGGSYSVFTLKEKRISPYLSYPLHIIKGNYSTRFIPKLGYLSKSIDLQQFSDDVKSIFYSHEFQYSRRKATAQALPNLKYNQSLRLENGKNQKKNLHLFEISNELTLPGLMPTHSTKLAYAYRNHTTDAYQYSWDLITPTGYFYDHNYIGQAIQSEQMNYFGLHYQLPLAYPNISLGKLAYIKRLRLEGFYQKAIFTPKHGESNDFRSQGIHFYIDANWFQTINAGLILTYSNTPDSKESKNYFSYGLEILL